MPRKSDITAVARIFEPDHESAEDVSQSDCPHNCNFGHSADACGWCPECHPEVPEW